MSNFKSNHLRIIYRGLLIISIIYFFSCHFSEKSIDSVKEYASLDDSTKYVGIQTCKECHADKYESFIHTGMGLSFDKASQKKSSADFNSQAIIHDSFRNLYYHPFWEGDSLKIFEFRFSGKDTTYKRIENISWIVGSGQHTNSHLMNVNGYVYQVPATFYTQKKKWDLPPGFEGGFNSRFSRKIGLECMTCHNAYPKMVLGSENKFSFVANGIDCERCHGPGEKHVKEMKAGNTIDISKEIDYSIVNPAKLSAEIQMDICQRCHIQGNAILKEGKTFFDFRPGMHLKDVMDVYMPLYKGDEDSHIMASHAERLKMSKCYINTTRKVDEEYTKIPTLKPYQNSLTCVTCHDPHISVRVTSDSVFNSKCISCHILSSGSFISTSKVCSENNAERLKKEDNCVSCHMPKGNSTDIPHVVTTDHRIRVLGTKDQVKTIKEFAGLICINNPAADDLSKGEAFLSYFEKFSSNPAFLDSAKKYFKDTDNNNITRNIRQLIHWAFLKNDFYKVTSYVNAIPNLHELLNKTSYTNKDAWTSYRIGESFSALGNNKSSIVYFSKAVELAPYVADFRNKLAGVLFDDGSIEEAKKNYEFIIRENPQYASAYVSYGFLILTTERNTERALSLYDQALKYDPDNLQAYLNKAGVMLYLGKPDNAKFYLKEVIKRDPNNLKAKSILKQIG